MDFYQRLDNMKPGKREELFRRLSGYGDLQEVICYINSMPICCEEYDGIFHMRHEVRIDSRFLVICYRKEVTVIPSESLRTFYVSACENFCVYTFRINNGIVFYVKPENAHELYLHLLVLCPDFFPARPVVSPFRIHDGTDLYFEGNDLRVRDVIFLFKVKNTVIPIHRIRSCYQLYSADPEDFSGYLMVRLDDGTEHKLIARDEYLCFCIAQMLKTLVPDLLYLFPQEYM